MSGHTPKPWFFQDGYIRGESQYGVGGEACVIAHVESGVDAPVTSTALANGDLMVAAPELLEALKNALYVLETIARDDGYDTSIGVVPQAKAAIAKAEGAR